MASKRNNRRALIAAFGAAVVVVTGGAVAATERFSNRPVEPLAADAATAASHVNVLTLTAAAPAKKTNNELEREPIQPIEHISAVASDPRSRERIRLGKRLFADRRLSSNDSVACASCHDFGHGGADGRKVAIGINGRVGNVNTPTVFNVDHNVKQFWDGRASSLEAQIDGPIQNEVEMSSTWPDVIRKISADETYKVAFAKAYPNEGIAPPSIRHAIASYERTLVTMNAPFDRYLGGDEGALSAREKHGYETFKGYGCISCHQGRNVGGNMFEKLGVMDDYFVHRGTPLAQSDYGRFNVTHEEADRFKFRVPSLRMVVFTAPYFHDGSAATLEDAVTQMAAFQLGVEIPPADRTDIIAFLGALAGTYTPVEE